MMFGPKNDERRGSAIKSITAIARVLVRPGSTKPRFCRNVSGIGHSALGSLRPVPAKYGLLTAAGF